MKKDKKKILIVEDEEPNRTALRDKFVHEGFDVTEARNGEEGLKLALKQRPDLILLDLLMPKMGGLAMLKELRADSWGKGVLVIILTVVENGEHVAEALEAGAFGYLVKTDWKLEEVVKKVKNALRI